MNRREFDRFIQKDQYQVFLFASPTNLPCSFAAHSWFVINRKGDVSRWEVLGGQKGTETSWGHLHKDYFPITGGVEVLIPFEGFRWYGTLLHSITGRNGSLADCMSAHVENSPALYPYNYKYSLTGPNSNSYTQWVLDQFPEANMRLPWNAVGKNYFQQDSSQKPSS